MSSFWQPIFCEMFPLPSQEYSFENWDSDLGRNWWLQIWLIVFAIFHIHENSFIWNELLKLTNRRISDANKQTKRHLSIENLPKMTKRDNFTFEWLLTKSFFLLSANSSDLSSSWWTQISSNLGSITTSSAHTSDPICPNKKCSIW